MAAKEETPLRFTSKPRRSPRSGSIDPLTSAVFDFSMAVGELKNAVTTLSSQGEAQTRELREIRDQIIGARAIVKFIGAIATFVGLAIIVKLVGDARHWF